MAREAESLIEPEDWLEEDKLILLEGWSRDGYAYRDIAKQIGITVKQLRRWRKEYPEITNALSKGREVTDYKVESALLKSALGYTTKETTIVSVLKDGQMVEAKRQTVIKEVAPSVSACQVWLYNRMPDKWKNKNARSNIIDELKDEDSNISITITRANDKKDTDDSDEWNDEITLSKNNGRHKKAKGPSSSNEVKDLNYWPDDWEED